MTAAPVAASTEAVQRAFRPHRSYPCRPASIAGEEVALAARRPFASWTVVALMPGEAEPWPILSKMEEVLVPARRPFVSWPEVVPMPVE